MRLEGARISLVPFGSEFITPRYLGWLSDDDVNWWSQRYGSAAQSADDAKQWLAGLNAGEEVFAICSPEFGHVGNIKYGPIDERNSRADISILLGEKSVWGKGIGREAVFLLMKFLFEEKMLNRLDAGSANPAFIALVKKLGWKEEGVLRERVLIRGGYVDWVLLSMLRREYQASFTGRLP